MAPEKLPLELEEEILIRVPPLSLARFRIVCKRWDSLFNDKRFVNNHLTCSRPEFTVTIGTKIYSVSASLDEDPKIKKREITLDIPGLESHTRTKLSHCDGLLLCTRNDGTTVWNPWLRQTRQIESNVTLLSAFGIGYDNRKPEKNYKIVGYTRGLRFNDSESEVYETFSIYEFATNAWKYIDVLDESIEVEQSLCYKAYNVSLNGNLYWVSYNNYTHEYFIRSFDCSKEICKPFCTIPQCKDYLDEPFLAVFKGDRFSILEQCRRTKMIDIWVTKNKIHHGDDGEHVVWIKFMTVSNPNCPESDYCRCCFLNYFVDNNIYGKTLVMCFIDEARQACIFIVRRNMSRKIRMEFVGGYQYWSSVWVPSLIPIPLESSYQENNKNLEV